MNRLSLKEGSLPKVKYDGYNLTVDGVNIALVHPSSNTQDIKGDPYHLGYELVTPNRAKKMIECPACCPTRVKEEPTETQQRGTAFHEYLAANPLTQDGVEWPERDKEILNRYYALVDRRKRSFSDLDVETEQERLVNIQSGNRISFQREYGADKKRPIRRWTEHFDLTLMARNDQVWRSNNEKLTKVQDLKLGGGRKTGNMMQLLCGALTNLKAGETFPKLSIYNLEKGTEEQYFSNNSEVTLKAFFHILTWTKLLLIGGWRQPVTEHEHVRTVTAKLENPKKKQEMLTPKTTVFIINQKSYSIAQGWEFLQSAWKRLEETIEIEEVKL